MLDFYFFFPLCNDALKLIGYAGRSLTVLIKTVSLISVPSESCMRQGISLRISLFSSLEFLCVVV